VFPISADAPSRRQALYLRAPSKTFAQAEKEAIVDFIKGGRFDSSRIGRREAPEPCDYRRQ